MYLVTTHVPIYVSENERFLSTDWKRSLELLRDSLDQSLGPVTVVGPQDNVRNPDEIGQVVESVDENKDGIRIIPSIPKNIRTRAYRLKYRTQWLREIRELVESAKCVHAGMDEINRSMMYDAWYLANSLNRPTVFAIDVDVVSRYDVWLQEPGPISKKLSLQFYRSMVLNRCRYGVKHASLSLLKGKGLIDRYGTFANNPKLMHDTSFTNDQIVSRESVENRSKSLIKGRPLRLVYCGRFVERKGLDFAIRTIAGARQRGVMVEFHLIGQGPQEAALKQLVRNINAESYIYFLGTRKYGSELIRELSQFDALLHTPTLDDTPRMIFDGYAAGLPLIGSNIVYNRERLQVDKAAILITHTDPERAIAEIVKIDQDRAALGDLAMLALRAAKENSAEVWYAKRAEWTLEAVRKHPSAS